jgi:carboxylate-amine ligase
MDKGSGPDVPTIGIEEEMFLVDAETLDCVPEMPERFERDARRHLGARFEREMISSMVELITSSHSAIPLLQEEVHEIRHKIARIAARHGMAVMACGTHPFADWSVQTITDNERYRGVAETVQLPSTRGHACGLHIHVGVDGNARIPVMNRMRQAMPLFLAVSTSSPFWQGRPSGLKSYRTAVNNEFPRSGIPPPFRNESDYNSAVTALKDAGIVPDESYMWWAIRPSANYPTVEMRVCDSCTRADDAIAIAGLYQVLAHHYARQPIDEPPFAAAREILIEENRWQASRHGIDARFLDHDTHGAMDVTQYLRRLVDEAVSSIEALDAGGCVADVTRIVSTGTSADRQLTVYTSRMSCDALPEAGLREVAHHIIQETMARSLTLA